jgi:hypothetical protein
MQLRKLVFAALLLALAVSVTRALVTNSGVGAFEYPVGVLVVGLLLIAAFHASRYGVGRASGPG